MVEPTRAPQGDYYRLRAEWLRFRSQLFDALTGLPALPAVMGDVAALLAEPGALELLKAYAGLPRGVSRSALVEFVRSLRQPG